MDFTTLSNTELSEAIGFHRRQRNMSRGVNESAHARQTQVVRLLEAEEARRLNEAVSVEKHNYSWGKMMTVHHGSSHSFPLHPEHQEKIKNLKDGESTSFKDETRAHVTATREGDKVHLKTGGAGSAHTTVAHSHFTEETQIDEAEATKSAYHYYVTKNDIGPKKKQLTHSKSKPFTSEKDAFQHILKSGGRQDGIIHKVHAETGKVVQNRGVASGQTGYASDVSGDDPKHVKDLKEEVEQIDEISKKLAKSYLDKSAAEREANSVYPTREKFRGRMIGGATADAKLKGRVQEPYKFGQAPKRKMHVKVAATKEEVDNESKSE